MFYHYRGVIVKNSSNSRNQNKNTSPKPKKSEAPLAKDKKIALAQKLNREKNLAHKKAQAEKNKVSTYDENKIRPEKNGWSKANTALIQNTPKKAEASVKPAPVKSKPTQSQVQGQAFLQLERYFSKLGIMSRGLAAAAILEGQVKVNGTVVLEPDFKINPDRDQVLYLDEDVKIQKLEYWILNKPRGFVTSLKGQNGEKTVYDLAQCPVKTQNTSAHNWLGPVGRLDKASEGLLLFTNDTHWANHILLPENHVAKTYHVQCSRMPSPEELEQLRLGILLDNSLTLPASWNVLRKGTTEQGWIEVELHEGRHRQIRRSLEMFGIETLRLIRVRFGNLELKDLQKGEWKKLSEKPIF